MLTTRKPQVDFKENSGYKEEWYDLREDWALIESSLAKQYGIRIRQELGMPWTEFCTLVGGLMPDTPLGQVVTIRAENDPEVISKFSTSQKNIHSEWRNRQTQKQIEDEDTFNKDMENLSRLFASICRKEDVK